jgi:hypothetical protein
MSGLDANGRVDKALRLLAPALQPILERELRRVYRANWRQNLSVAYGSDTSQPLDAYGALKTMLDNWQSCFKDTSSKRPAPKFPKRSTAEMPSHTHRAKSPQQMPSVI